MEYYYQDAAEQIIGPVSLPELQELRKKGIISDDHYIAEAGASDWMQYRGLKQALLNKLELVKPPVSLVPPMPPMIPSAVPGNIQPQSTLPSLPPPIFPKPEPPQPKMPVKLLVVVGGVIAAIIIVALLGVILILMNSNNSGSVALQTSPAAAEINQAAEASTTKVKESDMKVVVQVPDPLSENPSPAPPALIPKTELKPLDLPPPHPLAEWYDFGYRQGLESRRVYAWFDEQKEPTRQQFMQLLGNLEVKVATLNTEGVALAVEGFKDAVEGRDEKYLFEVPSDTKYLSILPAELRGYHKSKPGQSSYANSEDGNTELEHAIASTVMIQSTEGHGSGFFIAPGFILTNRHVVEGNSQVNIRIAESEIVNGKVISLSPTLDLAIVQIEKRDHPFLTVGMADKVRVGDEIFAVGYPIVPDISATVTFGRISNTLRVLNGNPCFHMDLTTNPGNSGGPIVTKNGHVVGLHAFGFGKNKGVDRFNLCVRMDAVVEFIKKNTPQVELTMADE